ncbi:toxin [Rhodococcus sp. IEGM 1318]|uniref:toxin n=1 Tax=Rhodococcus sp. IEGM 1318 TaxID=3082226 RepID=UPI002954A206|nr:toxin [Rhodococcus sp. IEGM 1318]MDV8009276.1 toxin [Rhodococcus sp. IEGM 1318]
MKAHKSARNHGITEVAGIYAAEHHVYIADLDDDNPARQLRLGFDPDGRLLELVVLRFDSGNELLIHAMKARSRYLDLLP